MTIGSLLGSNPTPNILIIITDQERVLGEWPKADRGWIGDRLKSMKRLKDNGLSFEQTYTAACMCSPSRATFQTSQYPVVTGCTTTGASLLPLPSCFPNLASVVGAAQYDCYWIGKWHLFGQGGEPGSQADALAQWGYQPYSVNGKTVAWDYPDAGWTLNTTYLAGGQAGTSECNANDHRFVTDAIHFLKNPPPGKPWCLVVSLVNPHDIHLGYKGEDGSYYDQSKYDKHDLTLPATVDQSTDTMPRAQAAFTWPMMSSGGATQQNFTNFYAYLKIRADDHVGKILDAMSAQLLQETLIVRFADHGEMGLAHGMVEKFVNAYGQSLHVPLVFSNPIAWPTGQTTEALASTLDLAPTLAEILAVEGSFKDKFKGKSLYPVLNGSQDRVQDRVHFTYDDESNGGPAIIRSVRTRDWVYSVYLNSVDSPTSGYTDADWEMYDLRKDPEEKNNLAGTGLQKQCELDHALQHEMIHKGTAPAWYPTYWPPQATQGQSRGGPPPSGCGTVIQSVDQVPGISPRQAGDLRYIGIRTTADLLACGADPARRKTTVNAMAVSEATFESWLTAAEGLTKAEE